MLNTYNAGPHFLQIPGPSNVPGRILRAMSAPTMDHRGPEFGKLSRGIFEDLKPIFQCKGPIVIFPSSGTGAWEAALANTLSPGDKVLMFETGHFATLWHEMATRLGLDAEFVPGDWRHGADPDVVEATLSEDREYKIKAVCVVHNETSTGVTSRVGEVRKAIDRANHPALLLVDTISSLASLEYKHDEWGVDVTVGCSQKGLMLPPGLGFNAISEKALKASENSGYARSYWRWDSMIGLNETGYFPYTPATNLLYGLREAASMLLEEGMETVFARHARYGEAARTAVRAWGLDIQCQDEREYSGVLTAVRMPDGHDADAFRKVVLESFNMSLGNGLTKLQGKVFRIGHLGDFNDTMLCGTLAGVEMGLDLAGVPHNKGGLQAAMDYLVNG
ncbi:MAG: aminotransferase class V-fold PLP-dependent enzyme [Rhodospirillales bacterium]|nr:aminotransferase class V-fold PLP-dependent enzyme [Rhodospirillales bacterium]